MHTHGTAVLDRPAEAVPAQFTVSQSRNHSSVTSAPTPAKSTFNATALADGHRAPNLTYGELAVALNASGIPPRYLRSADTAQLMAWAEQGVALLGIGRVRRYDRRTRSIHLCLIDHCMSARDEAEYARMWPNPKASTACHDAAYRIINTRPASRAIPSSRTAR